MTSLLRRKRRTTAPRTPRVRTAFKLAVFASLFGGAADAQQAGRPAAAAQANGLYAPPGYRQRTPPTPQPTPPVERAVGGGGRVMYFHTPADAVMPGDAPAEGVALAPAGPQVPSAGVPDVKVAAPAPGLLPTPRPLPTIPTATPPVLPTPTPLPAHAPPAYLMSRPTPAPVPVVQPDQPTSSTSQRQPLPDVKVDPTVTQLPSRDKIFLMYNDVNLAKVIVGSLSDERMRRRAEAERENAERVKRGDKPYDLPALPSPLDHPDWQFPTPARVVPAGTTYQPKAYEHRMAHREPTFVVHRRLHFEEKNAERYGWDLGAVQPLVSTLYFYRDTLLWPQSLVSGLVKGPWDTSAGKCLPGSPVPYYVYPLGLTVTGTVAEAGLITGLSFILPCHPGSAYNSFMLPPWLEPRTAYVHVPFCAHHCGYCDFAVTAGQDHLIELYLDALAAELAALGDPHPVESIFIGGGTPTHLRAHQLERLLREINSWLPFRSQGTGDRSQSGAACGFAHTAPEFSIESTPESWTPEKAALAAAHGVNRVSIGVQSFRPESLSALDRRHTSDQIPRAVEVVREHITNVSFDLIFAAPGSTPGTWAADLGEALKHDPRHISTYGLTYEKGTPLWKQRRVGRVSPVDEEGELAMYEGAIDTLTAAGFEHYEISNFARPGYRCRHNERYWANEAYFGFGVGAARYVNGVRELN
ncbi:MAG TPA: radical SAM family heme chaperone HemW, partial [Gemmataceae bacterium]|nr:radical SAM family heme chaperone HemW [Gemmataceae bacterium]